MSAALASWKRTAAGTLMVLGVGFLQLSSATAQPVLATVLSQSPAAVELGKGNYQGAYRLASERLQEARRAGRVEVDVLLEAAFASHATGQSFLSYELLEELLFGHSGTPCDG